MFGSLHIGFTGFNQAFFERIVILFIVLCIMTKKGKKNKKTKKQGKAEIVVPDQSIVYSGPIKLRKEKNLALTEVLPMNFTGIISSTVGGIIDSSYSSDPSTYALSDWTNFQGLYVEYRTLGLRVEFFPNNRYNKATVVCTPAIALVDREAGTLGSYQVAMSHESAKKVSWEDPWSIEARMNGPNEANWIDTSSSPTYMYYVKFYSDGLSVSTAYGRFFVYLLIEFRGRK